MTKRKRPLLLSKSWFKAKKNRCYIALFALAAATMLLYVTMSSNNLAVDTKTVRPLLNLIAEAESNGNYNAYFGNSSNKSPEFTAMSINDVQKWQADYIAKGSPSSAVGRYQFLDSTLSGLVAELNIDKNQIFNEKIQDKLAAKLLERRGVVAYVNKELPAKQFAGNLAQEWASLPMTIGKDPSKSYYDGDGLNESRVSVNKVLQAVDEIQPAK